MTDRKATMRGTDEVPPKYEHPDVPEYQEDVDPVTVEADGTVVVRLTEPLAPHGGEGEDPLRDLTKIRIRPLYARDLMKMDDVDGDMAKIVAVAKQLCGLPKIAFERLAADDFARVYGVVQGRLGKFLTTSAKHWAY